MRYKRHFLTPDLPSTQQVARSITVPDHPSYLSLVTGALLVLCHEENYEPYGAMSPRQTAELFTNVLLDYLQSNPMPTGSILAYPNSTPPNGWLLCDGNSYAIADYPRLASVLGQASNLSGMFTVPDLRDKFIYGAGTYAIGDTGGTASVTLSVAQMPSHSHDTVPHDHTYTKPTFGVDVESVGIPDPTGVGNPPLPAVTSPNVVEVLPTGGSEAHENMPPYVVMAWIIAT